ncbi:DUF4113 domain-containing protein [Paraburkholderia silvatlantica]|uniref:DUF4113 domain-containing protein n=1 Tax=Paraburkholderia silvatlantica TaxID=321895 RepID=A0ABR6FX85_9BURK|nr:DUF4113 domain-containing protein [Paraburkholderia silvatlantica]MBB2932045.1 hypothetical protein [Paraburkholderia silvatlantica]PVY24720.1 uncharacterized protein DUF4113 [Paraburkholderia silvatlantica]PXW31216.1 uncharacterized protein DUF4113 [Paraburkholderia silvatlantica]
MVAFDAVNDRFGRGTIRVENVEGYQAWHICQNAKTPNYTTQRERLPTARRILPCPIRPQTMP